VLVHSSPNHESAFAQNSLILWVRFHAIHLQATSPERFRKGAASGAEIDCRRGVRRFRREDFVNQPAVVLPGFLQQIEDVMSSILEQRNGTRERGWLKR